MLDTDTLLQLLADENRRRVLFSLCDTGSIRLPDAILPRGQVRSRQQEGSHSGPTSEIGSGSDDRTRRQMEMQLHHRHLPKLHQAGVIEWDRNTGTVSRGPQFEDIEPVLCLLAANSGRFPDDLL